MVVSPMRAFVAGVVLLASCGAASAQFNAFGGSYGFSGGAGGGAPPPPPPASYYVNYDTGSDSNAGTAALPWKHAPGDPAATGGPASVTLSPGAVIQFAGGVHYLLAGGAIVEN